MRSRVSSGVISGGARQIVSPIAGSALPARTRGSRPRAIASRATRAPSPSRRRLGAAVGDELDAAHHAEPAHIADCGQIAQGFEPGEQPLAHHRGALDQPLALDDLDIAQTDRAADRMAGIGRGVHEVAVGGRAFDRLVHVLATR